MSDAAFFSYHFSHFGACCRGPTIFSRKVRKSSARSPNGPAMRPASPILEVGGNPGLATVAGSDSMIHVCSPFFLLSLSLINLGSFLGGAYGVVEGLRHPAATTNRLRINTVLNAVTKRGPYLGNTLGVLGAWAAKICMGSGRPWIPVRLLLFIHLCTAPCHSFSSSSHVSCLRLCGHQGQGRAGRCCQLCRLGRRCRSHVPLHL